MEPVVRQLEELAITPQEVEVIEREELGHPDSLRDAPAEDAAAPFADSPWSDSGTSGTTSSTKRGEGERPPAMPHALDGPGIRPITVHGGGIFFDFQHQLDEAFDRLIYRRWAIPGRAEWRPRLDFHETRDAYLIEIDLPGVPPDRLEIRVAGRDLTIAGTRPATNPEGTLISHRERECGSFRRSLTLPHEIVPEPIQAEYRHGTCRIRLLKKKMEPTSQETVATDPGTGHLIQITIS